MIRIGITGGIGSGKSYISGLLMRMGIPVYDTDSEARRLMLEHPDIRQDLIQLLGDDVYKDGKLNKPVVAQYLFASAENAARINSIVHPRVYSDFLRWADHQTGKPVVGMESAILFEANFQTAVHKVLMVSAPYALRVERAMKRDGASREKIEERIRVQMSDEDKIKLADYVVDNDGRGDLQEQLCKIIDQLKR